MVGNTAREYHRFFNGQDREALLKSIALCREACTRVLIEAPIGEPPYLAAQKLVVAIDEATAELAEEHGRKAR